MNTPPVPSSVPISVHTSLVAPPPPVITPGPLTPPPVLTQEHIKPSPVITQEQDEPSPVITQDFDDDYSFVESSKPTPIIVRIKDPRPVYTIVRIKDPRLKLTYRNPHTQPHSIIVPTPKQSDPPFFPYNLRRSGRNLRTSNFLTHGQSNLVLPC